jgi:hypothetical protein
VYVFLKYLSAYHRKSIVVSPDRTAVSFDYAPFVPEVTFSRSVSYTETAGCGEKPTNRPRTEERAKGGLTGTPSRRRSLFGHLYSVRGAAVTPPFGSAAQNALPRSKRLAYAMPRSPLLDPKRKRLKDSVTVKEPFSRSWHNFGEHATVSGTYTHHLAITLKRLKLKR